MIENNLLMIAIFIFGLISLIGFFITKTEGFGRFTTSTFLIVLVITFAALMYSAGKLDGNIMANIIFAVFGFAGGLFTSKNGN